MSRRSLAVMACVSSLVAGLVWQVPAVGLERQSSPNLAGRWAIETTLARDINLYGVVGGDDTLVVTQNASTIVVERHMGRPTPGGAGRIRMTVPLDGSVATHTTPNWGLSTPPTLLLQSSGKWDGASLIVTTVATWPTLDKKRVETIETVTLKDRKLHVQRLRLASPGVERRANSEVYVRAR